MASALVTPVHVRVRPASVADIGRQATAAGVVEAFRTATVAAETNGRVVSRSVEPGDPVRAGQVLVGLDRERALIARDQAAARVRSREVDLEQAGNELQRGRDLHARKFISEDALEDLGFAAARAQSALEAARADLAAAERVLKDTEVRAPFTGIAETVHVHEGDYLNPGTPVVTLADFSRVRIKAGVTAREAVLLRGAERAELTIDAFGAETFNGRINSLARVSDIATGTFALEIWLDSLPGDLPERLREGMLATVYLPYPNASAPLTVPSAAVFRRGGAMHVFVVNAGRALLTPVSTGRTNGPTVEVLGGLAEGDLVVTDGQFALRDGARVTVED
ncbi:MAG: efflux RND transporter periplasmic adaptor subunit [Gammaproteobacteria bacterium]|nr:efflux RND transporter periplasmic adaptor subunit [Gammaproteobacteria bacterium]